MKDFVKRMINEHKQLNENIAQLNNFLKIQTNNFTIGLHEFGAMNIQLNAMQSYSEALTTRLALHGIIITDNGTYFEKINNE